MELIQINIRPLLDQAPNKLEYGLQTSEPDGVLETHPSIIEGQYTLSSLYFPSPSRSGYDPMLSKIADNVENGPLANAGIEGDLLSTEMTSQRNYNRSDIVRYSFPSNSSPRHW